MSASRQTSDKSKSQKKRLSPQRTKLRQRRKAAQPKVKYPKSLFDVPVYGPQSSSDDTYSSSDNNSKKSSDEDIAELYIYYEKEALQELAKITPSVKVVITAEVEAEIGIKNDPANSQLMQARKENLQIFFPEINDNFEGNKLLLVEYPKSLTEVDGTYSVFDNRDKANRASELIKRLDVFHRRKMRLQHPNK